MPIYDMRCSECGSEGEFICTVAEKDNQQCPNCDGALKSLIRPVSTIGPMPSKPLKLGGANVSFESMGELKKWERENPNTHVLSTNSKSWKDRLDRSAERADAAAKKCGFNDSEHFSKVQKREAASGGSWAKA